MSPNLHFPRAKSRGRRDVPSFHRMRMRHLRWVPGLRPGKLLVRGMGSLSPEQELVIVIPDGCPALSRA